MTGFGSLAEERAVRRVVRAVGDLDAAAFRRTAALSSPVLDAVMPRLSRAADHSVIWLAVAAVLDLNGSRLAGRAARRGVVCIGLTSLLTNAVAKRLIPRRRPLITSVPLARRAVRVPTSSSFPSGHAASAAAFATAVGWELPSLALPLGLAAGAVGFSRVYTGVHYPSDVLAGAALGVGVALTAARVAPLHTPTVVATPASQPAPQTPRPRGGGVVGVINPRSGRDGGSRVLREVAAELPDAELTVLPPGADLEQALYDAAGRAEVLAVGGGDGTVGVAAKVAAEIGLPLLVLPSGTFNHFAADLGITRPADAVAAVRAGTAIRADLGTVDGKIFVNTASLGRYPEFVATREQWEPRLGKPLASALAVVRVLLTSEPLRAVINGQEHSLVMLFVGNSAYQPHGFAPSWRPRLDDGKLDLRLVEAGRRLAAPRLVVSLLLGRLGKSVLYLEDNPAEVRISLPDGPTSLARDGEVSSAPAELVFEKQRGALTAYCFELRRHPRHAGPGAR